MCSFPALLSLCEYQAPRKKKSLVKITSPVYSCHVVEVHTMDKLVRVLRNFGIVVVSNPNFCWLFKKLMKADAVWLKRL